MVKTPNKGEEYVDVRLERYLGSLTLCTIVLCYDGTLLMCYQSAILFIIVIGYDETCVHMYSITFIHLFVLCHDLTCVHI